MEIFESEQDIIEKLNVHDQLINDCVMGKLSFWEFVEAYNNFFYYYALDGHESDSEELALLKKYESRISLHEQLAEGVLNKLCADEDAVKQSYIDSGRFGSEIAMAKISTLVAENT